MTEAEATATMDETPVELSAEDVEVTNASEQLPLNETVAPASESTLAVQNGAEQAEKNATPSEALPAEAPAKIEASNPSNGTTQTPATNNSDQESASVTRDPTDATVDVKMEGAAEEASQMKRTDAEAEETKADAEAAHENSDSSKEPAAKRLKVAAKPIDVLPPSSVTNATPTSTPIAASAVSAPLMMSRDDMAKMEEDTGLLKFDVITNDGTPEHMIQLTTLKNIFARQLPKMPREYIVRLVFDRNHRSMVILKNSKQVIGGICYRPFEPNHFAEIAFCAINAADQVKGYGTRLMNHLKEYVKASSITHFLTYADNYAIGYFKKQGFAKVVSMPRPNWFGYIKDYDGGTLMECTIHHQINYLRITSMVHAQRKKIQDKIKERSHADIIYSGLTRFAEGRTMDLYMIPGVQEAGWTRAVIRNSRVGTRDPGSLKTQLQQLFKAVSSHRSAWPFHEPVDTTIVVDYLDYIKEPIDLTLIQKRIESGHYLSKAAFKEELDKMCNNCMVYNTPDTNYYKAAKDLQEFVEKRVQVAK